MMVPTGQRPPLSTGQVGKTLGFRVPGYASDLNLEYQIERSSDLISWSRIRSQAPVEPLEVAAGIGS